MEYRDKTLDDKLISKIFLFIDLSLVASEYWWEKRIVSWIPIIIAHRDKTINDKFLIYIPNDDKQSYHICTFKLLTEKIGHLTNWIK